MFVVRCHSSYESVPPTKLQRMFPPLPKQVESLTSVVYHSGTCLWPCPRRCRGNGGTSRIFKMNGGGVTEERICIQSCLRGDLAAPNVRTPLLWLSPAVFPCLRLVSFNIYRDALSFLRGAFTVCSNVYTAFTKKNNKTIKNIGRVSTC